MLSLVLLVVALTCFLVEAIRGRSITALGLAAWVLSQIVPRI